MFDNEAKSNMVTTSSFIDNEAPLSSGGALCFSDRSSDNTITQSNLISHSYLAISNYDNNGATNNTLSYSYVAGNNGALEEDTDMSVGAESIATPPQWEGVTVSSPRSSPHPDAPSLP